MSKFIYISPKASPTLYFTEPLLGTYECRDSTLFKTTPLVKGFIAPESILVRIKFVVHHDDDQGMVDANMALLDIYRGGDLNPTHWHLEPNWSEVEGRPKLQERKLRKAKAHV